MDYVVHEAGGEVLPGGNVKCFGQIIEAGVFPIGCDADAFATRADSEESRAHAQRMKDSLAGRDLILGVDRLDYSKGIDRRFRAYSTLLERHAELRRRVSMLQIAPSSRADVPEYQDIRRQLEELSGHINGQFADYDWVPLRYVNRPHSSTVLASLYRASRVAFVTPLRDGMNLVAKEYVASQDEQDPGVLVLSRFAGAAYQMRSAIIVNPHDEEEMADALHQALMMPLPERIARWQNLVDGVRTDNVHWWLNSFLARLIEAPEAAEDDAEHRPGWMAAPDRLWGRVV
jgi:trehalose 6-phosphate synthase